MTDSYEAGLTRLKEQAQREQVESDECRRREQEESGHRRRQESLDLIAFLNARFDETAASRPDAFTAADIEAKRLVVKEYADTFEAADRASYPNEDTGGVNMLRWLVLPLLATPYTDHPDYQPEAWRPAS